MSDYKWWAHSQSKPPEHGLGFNTIEEAMEHANRMNELLKSFFFNPIWNRAFWQLKPLSWTISHFNRGSTDEK